MPSRISAEPRALGVDLATAEVEGVGISLGTRGGGVELCAGVQGALIGSPKSPQTLLALC